LKKKVKLKKNTEERELLKEESKKLKEEIDGYNEKLKEYATKDPELIQKKNDDIKVCKDSANRWTDNIFILKTYCSNNMNMESSVFHQAFDINEEFVSIAQRKCPNLNFSVGDMRSFDLGKKYDAVICMFSSIGYLSELDDIVSALNCFREHLNPEGIIIIEPWFIPEAFHPGNIFTHQFEDEGMKGVRMGYSTVEGSMSVLNFEYLFGLNQQGIQRKSEIHHLRLTSRDEMLLCFKQSNLIFHCSIFLIYALLVFHTLFY